MVDNVDQHKSRMLSLSHDVLIPVMDALPANGISCLVMKCGSLYDIGMPIFVLKYDHFAYTRSYVPFLRFLLFDPTLRVSYLRQLTVSHEPEMCDSIYGESRQIHPLIEHVLPYALNLKKLEVVD
jgi:hypothetical protein